MLRLSRAQWMSCLVAIVTLSSGNARADASHYTTTANTVLDMGTELTWERRPSVATYTFAQAATYCSSLEADAGAWRVPTIKELLTLVDEARSTPAIDGRAFPNTPADYFWSSSKTPQLPSKGWAVSFRFGFDAAFELESPKHVRCVHSKK